MKNKIVPALLIAVLFLLNACTEKSKSGYFVLTRLDTSANATSGSALKSLSADFDFGMLKASKEFYLLLSNGGDQPIFDIYLSSENESFSVFPSSIAKMQGKESDGESDGDVIPVITIGISHGIALNGVGYVPLLPYGTNSTELVIQGKTLDNGDTVDIESRFIISVTAMVMDIKFYNGESKIDLYNPDGYTTIKEGFAGLFNNRGTNTVSLVNTGNVPIEVYYGDSWNPDQHISVGLNDSVSVNLTLQTTVFALDGDGTIIDPEKVLLGSDGLGYFGILNTSAPPL